MAAVTVEGETIPIFGARSPITLKPRRQVRSPLGKVTPGKDPKGKCGEVNKATSRCQAGESAVRADPATSQGWWAF